MKAITTAEPTWLKAVIFDLDETLLARSRAWRYALEQAVLTVTGRRIDASKLEGEYRARPWRHAIGVIVPEAREAARCETVCREMYARSAMKQLLVHDGIGMALDVLRGARVEIAAISREPHRLALTQAESTGLDRFLTVLAATGDGELWDAGARAAQCLGYLGRAPETAVLVTGDTYDLALAQRLGAKGALAAWVHAGGETPIGAVTLAHPAELGQLVARLR